MEVALGLVEALSRPSDAAQGPGLSGLAGLGGAGGRDAATKRPDWRDK